MQKYDKYKIFDDMPPGAKGFRRIYKFPNGYGARVTNYGGGTDIAVCKFDDDLWIIDKTTPVTCDVLLNVKNEDIDRIFKQILELD